MKSLLCTYVLGFKKTVHQKPCKLIQYFCLKKKQRNKIIDEIVWTFLVFSKVSVQRDITETVIQARKEFTKPSIPHVKNGLLNLHRDLFYKNKNTRTVCINFGALSFNNLIGKYIAFVEFAFFFFQVLIFIWRSTYKSISMTEQDHGST